MPVGYLALFFEILQSIDELEYFRTFDVEILAPHSAIAYFFLMLLRVKKIATTEIKIQSPIDLSLLPECLFLLPKLKGLDLQLANLKSQTIKHLMQTLLAQQPALKTLRLPYNPDMPIDTRYLNLFLRQSQVEELSLGALHFSEFMPHFGHLKSLHLSHLSANDCLGLGEMSELIKLSITDSIIPEYCFYKLKLRNLVALTRIMGL